MPPLTALQAWLARSVLGDSMLAIRFLPALAGAGLVLLAGAVARALRGRRFAQGLAALAVVVAPGYLAFDSYLSMNSVEPLLWMGCALLLIRIIDTGNDKLWLWFGAVAGLGLQNKHTMLTFGGALIAGLFVSRQRPTQPAQRRPQPDRVRRPADPRDAAAGAADLAVWIVEPARG